MSYENRCYPAEAVLVHGLDVDYSHAVGLPSSKLRSFVRGGACPLQWLPVLLAVVGMPPQLNFTEYVMHQLYLDPQPEVQALIDSGAGIDEFEALCKGDHMKSICAEHGGDQAIYWRGRRHADHGQEHRQPLQWAGTAACRKTRFRARHIVHLRVV